VKRYLLIGSVIFIFIILFPIVINYSLFTWEAPRVGGSEEGWLGFLANYSGGIIGGIVALLVARIQIKSHKKLESEKEFLAQLPALIKIEIELQNMIEQINSIVEQRLTREEFSRTSFAFISFYRFDENNWSEISTITDKSLLSALIKIKNLFKIYQSVLEYDLNQSFVTIETARLQMDSLLNKERSEHEEVEFRKASGLYHKFKYENESMQQLKGEIWDKLSSGEFLRSINGVLANVRELISRIEKDKK